MKKKHKLKNSQEIQKIIFKKQAIINSNYILNYYKDSNEQEFKIAISVSKKLGNAVYRNKYKRKMREIVRLNQSVIPNGYRYVIILRPMSKDKDYHKLNNSFIDIMKKMNKEI